jgi:hypothetical protein
MKKLFFVTFAMLVSISASAATEECVAQLDSMIKSIHEYDDASGCVFMSQYSVSKKSQETLARCQVAADKAKIKTTELKELLLEQCLK